MEDAKEIEVDATWWRTLERTTSGQTSVWG